ncbi:MAG: extracellular solute-binding protein [Thermomicrobiales bacterium]
MFSGTCSRCPWRTSATRSRRLPKPHAIRRHRHDTTLCRHRPGVRVGAAYFSTILTYPAGSQAVPDSWADFWTAVSRLSETFEPTQYRSLRRSPVGTLEFALLADGVAIEELYPLDIDRAFASLDRIRENVLVWWQEGKEPVELVATGSVGMASAFSPRIDQLALGSSIRTLWYQGMLSADAWVVPRGTQNDDVAMDFIAFATRAIPTANFSRLVPYGPVNVESFEYLRRERVEVLPSAPANKAVQFVEDFNFWANNVDTLTERFEAGCWKPIQALPRLCCADEI